MNCSDSEFQKFLLDYERDMQKRGLFVHRLPKSLEAMKLSLRAAIDKLLENRDKDKQP